MTVKTTIFPSRYVQGAGAISLVGEQVALLGATKVLTVGGERGLAATREGRAKSFAEKGIKEVEEKFRGECSWNEVHRLTEIMNQEGCDAVLASGGGKTIDTVKVVAGEARKITLVVPTTASTDAPCSRLSVLYHDDGEFEAFYLPPRNPDLVLVDTEVIAKSPVRLLIAGMGDALATYWEADACFRSQAGNMSGTPPSKTAMALAKLCYDTLIESGLQAKIANEAGVITPALEAVVEANTLLSGLGFESGGLAAAHSMQDGFTVLEEIHHTLHGEKVGFLTLVQLVMEERPAEVLNEVFQFNKKIGLPLTLADLNIDKVGPARLMEAVRMSSLPGKIMHNHAFKVTEQYVYDCVLAADAMGQRVKAGQPIV